MVRSEVQQLEDIARDIALKTDQNCTVQFVFTPNSIGPYGPEGSQWQATFSRGKMATVDYGSTIDEAAKRLLDRLQRPEAYSEPKDD